MPVPVLAVLEVSRLRLWASLLVLELPLSHVQRSQ